MFFKCDGIRGILLTTDPIIDASGISINFPELESESSVSIRSTVRPIFIDPRKI